MESVNLLLQILEKFGFAVVLGLFVLLVVWKWILPFIKERFNQHDINTMTFVAHIEKKDKEFLDFIAARDNLFIAMQNQQAEQLKENTKELARVTSALDDLTDKINEKRLN